jgi:hypothetical protein
VSKYQDARRIVGWSWAGQHLKDALEVLREFVQDVDAVGREHVAEEWPDLLPTYDRAKEVLREDWAPQPQKPITDAPL